MLGWITGQTEEERRSTDNAIVAEPPQTPAPVFAIRAFKSALFGTPAGEDDTFGQSVITKGQGGSIMQKNNTVSLESDRQKMNEKQIADSANQLGLSPTKSILVTPGTTSNRRKTVSFGGTVLHHELRNDKNSNTSPSASGSVTNQWMSSQTNTNSKPRSKLTQSLLDARERSSEELPRHIEPARNEKLPTMERSQGVASAGIVEKSDVTINLEDPQSESGQYWKTEFDNYRKRTNLEIRKLIQYRSAARSYARKKDTETMRLTEKLRKEEEKVAEMERRVTELASNMVSKGVDVDKDELVQDLTRQTALAVQSKHKVDTLRKTLQRHGVVGGRDEQSDLDESLREGKEEIRRLQHALDEANKKLEQRSHDDELEKLRNLAKSSEAKVLELEKENAVLKQGIVRFKEGMDQYEERRLEKEGKLKLRAAKLEKRTEEYKEKLREYRDTIEQERAIYREEIESLKNKISDMKHSSRTDHLKDAYHNPPNGYAGVQVHDFGGQRVQMPIRNPKEMLQVGNRNPNSCKSVPYDSQPNFSDEGEITNRGPTEEAKESTQRIPSHWSRVDTTETGPSLLPSSPPWQIETPQKPDSKKPSMTPQSTITDSPLQVSDLGGGDDGKHRKLHVQKRKPDALSKSPLSQSQWASSATSSASKQEDYWAADRAAAARARLQEKEENRRK